MRRTESGFEPNFDQRLETISFKDESMTSFTLTNLKPSTYYRIELRAKNDLGFSSPQFLLFRTASDDNNNQLIDDSEEGEQSLSTSSMSLSLIIGLILIGIIILLVLMDIYFYYKYKVGVIYFVKTHVFSNDENEKRNRNSRFYSFF